LNLIANFFVEGILVAKKDFNAPGHIDLHKIPNLQVIKACQSLTSRGYVKTQFSWQYYYYTLTNEGIGTRPPFLQHTASTWTNLR